MVSGIRYWMDNWQQAKRDADDDKCKLNNDNKCVCDGFTDTTLMPTLRKSF